MAKKQKSKNPLAVSINTDAKAVLFAHSVAATSADPKKDSIFKCVVAAFDNAGLTHITSLADSIVWQVIPDGVIKQLGQSIRNCVTKNVADPGDLVGPFAVLKSQNRVMTVGDLVDGIAELV